MKDLRPSLEVPLYMVCQEWTCHFTFCERFTKAMLEHSLLLAQWNGEASTLFAYVLVDEVALALELQLRPWHI